MASECDPKFVRQCVSMRVIKAADDCKLSRCYCSAVALDVATQVRIMTECLVLYVLELTSQGSL